MITAYSFGRMTIGEKEFTSDLIIYPGGRVQDCWRRKSGHVLEASDITALIDAGPEVIIAGTGAYGIMKPDPGLVRLLSERGIVLQAEPTARAVELYNRLAGAKSAAGCFHLTC